jgi:XTP/dITP diphosphohydrolase
MSVRLWVLATGNRHKLDELAAMLEASGIDADVRAPSTFGTPPEIVEDGDTFTANAMKKAVGVAGWLRARDVRGDALVLADDSGLCVDALGGAPGVISARFAGEPTDDAANNRKLVSELGRLGLDESPAHYRCVLALVRVDGGAIAPGGENVITFDGRWDVAVRVAARGTGGFGYDPHAWLDVDGEQRTVAELQRDAKGALSHRGQAHRTMLAWWRAHHGGGALPPG